MRIYVYLIIVFSVCFSIYYYLQMENNSVAEWHSYKGIEISSDLPALQEKAAAGDAHAQWNLGLFYKEGYKVKKDYTQAALWFERAAEQGHVKAQKELGSLYKEGKGVEKNYEQALKWYKLAADQGDVWAQWELGGMYHKGQGVDSDAGESFKWIKSSAGQGLIIAQLDMGIIYMKGLGVEQDYLEAYFWYALAEKQSAQYRHYAREVEKHLNEEEIEGVKKRVNKWIEELIKEEAKRSD